MTSKKNFTETEIFRTSSLLLRESQVKVRNMQTDVRDVFGKPFLDHIRKCIEYAKISYIELRENKLLKYLFICKSKYEIEMAETDLNAMVSSYLIPGKQKQNESTEIYLNGGSEISKQIGCLKIQIDSFKNSLENDLGKEDIEKVKEKLLNI